MIDVGDVQNTCVCVCVFFGWNLIFLILLFFPSKFYNLVYDASMGVKHVKYVKLKFKHFIGISRFKQVAIQFCSWYLTFALRKLVFGANN